MPKLNRSTLALIAFLLGAFSTGAQNRPVPEGVRPYTPTRLEFMALDLESHLKSDLGGPDMFSMDFTPNGASPNEIVIVVRYLPTADRQIMNESIENAKKIIALESKHKGWSSWLTVREDVEILDHTK